MAGYRIDRISEDIKRELISLMRELKDPRVSGKMLTVVNVNEGAADAVLHPRYAFQRREDRSFLYHSSASFRRCRARIALSPSMTFSHCAMFSHSMRSTWATRLMKP